MIGFGVTEVFLINSVSAVGAVVVSRKRGYSPVLLAALGIFLGPIGFIVALILPNRALEAIQDEQLRAFALSDYKKLLDEGGISQEEYDRKKEELMGR